MNESIQAPVAKKIPYELKAHNQVRIDNYFWLNDRENKEVLAYLEAEKAYYQASTAHTKALQETLFSEMKKQNQRR